MKPSELRARVLADHVQLRKLLSEVIGVATRTLAGEKTNPTRLHAKARQLRGALLAHIDMEDKLLYPAIVDVDAWGPVRGDRMRHEHAEQRAALARFAAVEWRVSTLDMARALDELGNQILEDMHHEEHELLDPDLLRDDVVSIAQVAD